MAEFIRDLKRTHSCGELTAKDVGKEVILFGWVHNRRDHGGAVFIDLREPPPGELGPAVLLGHVDSAEYGPGVFFRLGALRPGDTVSVTRADARVATFRVTRVASFPKDRFPTLAVYGNTADAELRLITCGGAFDSSARSYENNIVVYAVLTGSSAG